ncbi:MAG: fructose-bisphosphate aldolase [Bacteroidota bacterium]
MDQLRFFRHASFSSGEITRVHQILRPNGTTFILPYDQFIEHDCRHLEAQSDSGNPKYLLELARDAGHNGVALHYGLSKRFWSQTEGRIPLIVKVNGKTSIPPEKLSLSVHTSWVEDAVRLGAVGIGYTMYYGSPRQDVDLPQLAAVRKECERYGMPLIIWAYPRGEAIDAKGGRETSYALESAARLATEMGATIIKSNLPRAAKDEFLTNESVPKYFRKLEQELKSLSAYEQKLERARRVVRAAQGIPVLFSGGDDKTDAEVLENAEVSSKAGCFGFIYGRNMWKRKKEHAIEMFKKLAVFLDQSVEQPAFAGGNNRGGVLV